MAAESRAEQIADRLRRDILLGVLAPGAAIKERDSAQDMGVSRTPMREAIRILAKEGLVALRPSRSPVVAQPTLEDVTDAIDVLTALELLSVRLACERASDAEIAAIREIEREVAAQYGGLDPVARFEHDMGFHKTIAAAAHNAMLAETHGAYLARLWRARYLSTLNPKAKSGILVQHAAIAEALGARDAATAEAHLAAHLAQLRVNVRDFFQSTAVASAAGQRRPE
ncbi:GntR family transcriptional regulator [Marinovum sp.]|uniref:GntR family transcriptional regulator n=1 Tax=Marinovum sp. TaxID=2024839 RepID=UPI002B268BA3|nr:GntR family transcriptional regulator [Marinovum sp.]